MWIKTKRVLLTLLLILLCVGVLSQFAGAAVMEKTGFVDVEKIFQEYAKKKDLEAKLQAEGEVKRQQLAEKRQELEELQKEYEAQKLLLTEEAKRERQEEINKKSEALKEFLDKISNQMKEKENQYTQEILSDIRKKIEEIAKKEGYIYILDRQCLLYAAPDPELDLTQRIIDELNKEYGAGE